MGRRCEHVYNALGLEVVACGASWGVSTECSSCMQLKNTAISVKQALLHEAVNEYIYIYISISCVHVFYLKCN